MAVAVEGVGVGGGENLGGRGGDGFKLEWELDLISHIMEDL